MAEPLEQTIADWEIPMDRTYDDSRDDEKESKLADCYCNGLDRFPAGVIYRSPAGTDIDE